MRQEILLAALAIIPMGVRAAAADFRREVLGINIDPQNAAASPGLPEVSKLGLARVRFTVKKNLDSTERAVRMYIGAGIPVVLVLNNETVDIWRVSFHPEMNGAEADAYRSVYNEVVKQVAQRFSGYNGMLAYEIWNEPDCPKSKILSENYGPMLAEAAKIIKQVDPSARVISGGVLQHEDKLGESYDYLMQALGKTPQMLDYVDELGLHTYGDHPDAYAWILQTYYRQFKKPLAVTEWSPCVADERETALRMSRYLTVIQDETAVAEAYYFSWSDTQDLRCQFGLSNAALKPDMPWVFGKR